MDILKKNYGSIIKKARESKKISIRELARQAGIAHPQVIRSENERYALTLSSAMRITRVLGMPLDTLLANNIAALIPLSFENSKNIEETNNNQLTRRDLEILDQQNLLSTGRASTIIHELMKLFLLKKDPNLREETLMSLSVALEGVISIKRPKTLPTLNLPSTLPAVADFRYPSEYPFHTLQEIFYQKKAAILLDIGAYIRSDRTQKKISLRQLSQKTGLSHQGINQMEFHTAEKIRLEDIIKLDIALNAQGELLAFAWSVAEFYAGVYREKSRVAGVLIPYQAHEIHGIEKIVVLSRLFQYFFPDDATWLNKYKQLIKESSFANPNTNTKLAPMKKVE